MMIKEKRIFTVKSNFEVGKVYAVPLSARTLANGCKLKDNQTRQLSF